MNIPIIYNFPDHYHGDGLSSFTMTLKYKETNDAVNLAAIKMQLVNSIGAIIWEFSSELEGDNKLTIMPGGIIEFPEIKKWKIPSSRYFYDMQGTDVAGFVSTYLKGEWKVNKDITI